MSDLNSLRKVEKLAQKLPNSSSKVSENRHDLTGRMIRSAVGCEKWGKVTIRTNLSTKAFCYGLVALACACEVSGRTEAGAFSPQKAPSIGAPGIYKTPPPGIDSVKGECVGKIALTPGIPHATAEGHPYPVIYDCSSKSFAILNSQTDLVGLADLTLTKDGYYLHQTKITDSVWHGGYFFYDHSGRQIGALARPDDPGVHDLIVRDQDITYLKYVPDWDSARCGRGVPLEIEIITESLNGKILWTWSSKGRFDVSQNVATAESTLLPVVAKWRRSLAAIRHCYTSIARRIVKFETPKWFVRPDKFPLLHLEQDDYIHANSIQWVEPSGDILVSARHLDTVFLIDRKTGALKWSLGGKFAKATPNRPVDDPRGGFSHQHYARIVGKTLWVFDNGNLFPDLPSRAVAYQLDSSPPPNRFVFEFPEPNGKQRDALGSVQVLENNQLLIGWGNVKPADRQAPQRAVSIVRLHDGKEVFSMDLSPSWISYRVKAFQR